MANKREFPRDMSFVDRLGDVVHPSREDYEARKYGKVGRASAFFDTSASKPEIERIAEAEAKRIVDRAGHGKLEYFLTQVKDIREEQDPEVYDFIQKNRVYPIFPSGCRDQIKDAKPIKITNLKYALVAARHGKTDKEAAGYLGNVMYHICREYEAGKPFNVGIVYRNPEDGYLDFKRD